MVPALYVPYRAVPRARLTHPTGHIEWHLEVGLAVQLIEAPLQAQQLAPNFPPIMSEYCTALGKPNSGNAAGFASATDLTGLPLGPYLQKLGWLPKGIVAMFGCVWFRFVWVSPGN